jgi:DNA ligase-1
VAEKSRPWWKAVPEGAATRAEAARPPPTANRQVSAPTPPGVAPPLLLAHSWENDVDLTGWWMSEKLDGVRAFWDGANLVSRLGNVFVAPDWFVEQLPKDLALDGELFGGRGKFQRTVSIVRRQDKGDAWREIHYVVFDAPKLTLPFEDRLRSVRERLEALNLAHVRAHPHEPCRDVPHLREELARVESLGGEGLMMRKPGSRYEVGRSHTLLKVKTFKDAEARVVEYGPGLGKHVGRVGALICELPNGKRFNVGTGLSNEERAKPPPIGSIITFRYQELTNDGIPRFPSYVGVRDDVVLPPPPPVAITTTRDARVFVREGTTWEIRLTGNAHVIRRVRGEAVESLTTTFSGGALAWRDAERRIAEQLENGFTEVAPED